MMTTKKTQDDFFWNNLDQLRSKPNSLKSESLLKQKKKLKGLHSLAKNWEGHLYLMRKF